MIELLDLREERGVRRGVRWGLFGWPFALPLLLPLAVSPIEACEAERDRGGESVDREEKEPVRDDGPEGAAYGSVDRSLLGTVGSSSSGLGGVESRLGYVGVGPNMDRLEADRWMGDGGLVTGFVYELSVWRKEVGEGGTLVAYGGCKTRLFERQSV